MKETGLYIFHPSTVVKNVDLTQMIQFKSIGIALLR